MRHPIVITSNGKLQYISKRLIIADRELNVFCKQVGSQNKWIERSYIPLKDQVNKRPIK